MQIRIFYYMCSWTICKNATYILNYFSTETILNSQTFSNQQHTYHILHMIMAIRSVYRHLNASFCCCFNRYLLEQDFPGMRIGPEPTTDSFIAVMHGNMEGLIPGNALVVDPKKPFRKLNAFGNAFLNRWD